MRGLQPLAEGGYRIRLERHERELVDALAAELEQLVRADDDAVARLFPAAYKNDEVAAEEFRRLTRGSLAEGRLRALRVVRDTVAAERLDEGQADAWCTALNDIRLVLGERLSVTEDLYERELDPRDPRAPELAVYAWLTWLQASVIDALSLSLSRKRQESAEADS